MSFLMSVKNLRRSLRLLDDKDEMILPQNETSIGYFETLPIELQFIVFSYIPVIGLSNLALTSKATQNLIELYRRSETSQKYLFPHPLVHSLNLKTSLIQYIDYFRKYGVLFKRSTCLYSTKDRLKLLSIFLIKHHCAFFTKCDITNCINLTCCGAFIHTVTAGWDDKELVKVLEAVTANSMVTKNVEAICRYKPGTFCLLETYTRLFYRRLFIDPCSTAQEKAFWMNQIIKNLPIVSQARVIFLLFGPHQNEHIQWYEFVETVPASKEHSLRYFTELASALRLLFFYSKNWQDNVVSIIEELTNVPEDWMTENIANLLFLCGDQITCKVLVSKAINGRLFELSNIVAFLVVASFRHESSTSWVVGIIRQLCRCIEVPKYRAVFIEGVSEVFRENIVDLQDFSNTDGDLHEFEFLLDAQLCFLKEMMRLVFHELTSIPLIAL